MRQRSGEHDDDHDEHRRQRDARRSARTVAAAREPRVRGLHLFFFARLSRRIGSRRHRRVVLARRKRRTVGDQLPDVLLSQLRAEPLTRQRKRFELETRGVGPRRIHSDGAGRRTASPETNGWRASPRSADRLLRQRGDLQPELGCTYVARLSHLASSAKTACMVRAALRSSGSRENRRSRSRSLQCGAPHTHALDPRREAR